MNNFYIPFFRYRYPGYPHYPLNQNYSGQIEKKFMKDIPPDVSDMKKDDSTPSLENISQSTENAILEFHGIKLYSDDLLILLLIYFLYKEGNTDTLLYILLFTLLFTE